MAGAGIGVISGLVQGQQSGRQLKKYQKHEKRFVKRRLKYGLAQLGRSREQFQEDSERYEQRVMQSLAGGRNVGFSSIAREEEERIRRARGRALQTYAERIDLAKRGYQLYKRKLKLNRKLAYIGATGAAVSGAGEGLDAYLSGDRSEPAATGQGGQSYGAGSTDVGAYNA